MNTIAAIYNDSTQSSLIIYYPWNKEMDRVEISLASFQAVLTAAQADNTISDSEGYDDDPSARIYWLRYNSYANLLEDGDRADFHATYGREYSKRLAAQRPSQRRNPMTGRFIGGARGVA